MIAEFDGFRIDTAQCSLTRQECPVRLAKLPFDLLVLLIERRGHIVKREEIAAVLWGEATFVDAEHGTNTAIKKIRAALGEDPAAPKYIETVIRRGYRFRAEVSILAPPPLRSEGELAPEAPALGTEHLPMPLSPPRIRPLRWATMAALAAAVLASAGWLGGLMKHGSPRAAHLPALRWRALSGSVHTFTRLASDGKSAFWTEYLVSGCKPVQAPLDGGEVTPVRVPFENVFVADVTPDGRMLLIVRENCTGVDIQGPLWEMTLASGKTRRVGGVLAQEATYSPDGSQIAWGHWDQLWIANRDASGARLVATVPGMVWGLHWSPDGRKLRFSTQISREYRYPLWEVAAEGKEANPVFPQFHKESQTLGGVWLGNGDFIFENTRNGATDLWRVPSGKPPEAAEQLTAGPLEFSSPTTIPGRDDLLVRGTRNQGELVRFDRKAGSFVPFLKGISAQMVDFSRDGKWVVYVTYPERELWRSRTDGSGALQLTRGPMRAGLPRVSPDGSQVAFTGGLSDRQLRTWLVPFDGGEPRPLTHSADAMEVAPTWSPDGARILVRLDRPGGDSVLERNVLEIVDVRSGATTQVPGSERKFNQRWSPDGKWLLATPNDSSEADLFDMDRREWKILVRTQVDYPSWSADSRFVYFGTRNGQEFSRVEISRGRVEPVARLEGIARAVDDVYGGWSGITPEGDPMILRASGFSQIYLLSTDQKN